ncbi:B12-binding domain-containing radical SAM protein [candidate division WOR-3 bacterium]|nr:B12-binding domain-containing radical SAM protein [candidate division WOR-3 bacterium]
MEKKKPFLKSAVNIGMICPGGNAATFSSLALHYMKRELSSEPGIFADFLLERKGTVTGFESGLGLSKFDILAVTASWAGDYFPLKKLLAENQEKITDLKIITGGPGALSAPESFLELSDAVFFGDADGIFTEIMRDILSEKTDMPWLMFKGDSKSPGIRFSEILWGKTVLKGSHSSFGETGLVEISRGCPYSCKFCWLSGLRKRFEPRNTEDVLRDINSFERGKIGLVSAAFLSHPDIKDLVKACQWVSPPSCRMDLVTPEILELLHEKKTVSLTLAPETLSERLSEHIGKPFHRDALFKTASWARSSGIRKLKLYMMTGLPSSDDDDTSETAETLFSLSESTGIKIEASFNQFIPMPFSGFALSPLCARDKLEEETEILKKRLERTGVSLRFSQPKKTEKIYGLLKKSSLFKKL